MPQKDPKARAKYLREHEAAISADPEKLAVRRAQQRAAHKRRYEANPEKYRVKSRDYYADNSAKELARAARWRLDNPEWHREHNRKYRYGVSPEVYDALLSAQGGHCVFCKHKRLVVDHDHTTGQVRGLICKVHNTALRNFGDDEAGVLRLLAYVRGLPVS
jgi:hypothetical protein